MFRIANGEALSDLVQEGEGTAESEMPHETEHPEAGAVVQRRVLIGPLPANLHVFHIDLDRIAGLRLFEEPQLPRAWCPLPPAGQMREPEPVKDLGQGRSVEPNAVHSPEPDLRSAGAVLEFAAGVLNQPKGLGGQAGWPPCRVPRHEAQHALGPVAISPPPDGLPLQPEVPARRLEALRGRVGQHTETVFHPPPILRRNLGQSCRHGPLLDGISPILSGGVPFSGRPFNSTELDFFRRPGNGPEGAPGRTPRDLTVQRRSNPVGAVGAIG